MTPVFIGSYDPIIRIPGSTSNSMGYCFVPQEIVENTYGKIQKKIPAL